MAKILLVDDEAYVTTTVATKLARMGHQTLTACDGLDGFNRAQAERPDLIVSDLQMPSLDGLAMAQRLAEAEPTRNTPVILLTGRGHLIPPQELSRTCVKQLVAKPFSVRDLVELVDKQLKSAA